MKIDANLIRSGNILRHKNRLLQVLNTSIIKPGKGGAFIQVEMKDIRDGTKYNERWRTVDTVEKALVTEKTVKVSKQPVYLERNLLLHLADLPFGTRNGTCGITLEAGTGNLTDSLILDGQLPFDEGDAFIVLDLSLIHI